eukprot:TRINITY_DN91456_c0_g1_i1.p1 TRINITY_DN91456_c0_g1~~TRINITY_DN91456_c0_g1_i1.p1  ORF type:complete len:193 (-),score=16.34 TRINITY_DN91456_c0_g1_i1:328-906(-)
MTKDKEGRPVIMGGAHRKWLVRAPSDHTVFRRSNSRDSNSKKVFASIEEKEAFALERHGSKESFSRHTSPGTDSERNSPTSMAEGLTTRPRRVSRSFTHGGEQINLGEKTSTTGDAIFCPPSRTARPGKDLQVNHANRRARSKDTQRQKSTRSTSREPTSRAGRLTYFMSTGDQTQATSSSRSRAASIHERV